MLKNLFRKKECTTIQSTPSYSEAIIPNIPNGKWINCKKCKNIIYIEDIENNSYICPKCNYHFNISTYERVREIFDNKVQTKNRKNKKKCKSYRGCFMWSWQYKS